MRWKSVQKWWRRTRFRVMRRLRHIVAKAPIEIVLPFTVRGTERGGACPMQAKMRESIRGWVSGIAQPSSRQSHSEWHQISADECK